MKVITRRRFADEYFWFWANYCTEVSAEVAERFEGEVDAAIAAIIAAPTVAGHFVKVGSAASTRFRRRNLKRFPFFILYLQSNQQLVFAGIIPSRSNPKRWFEAK